MSVCDIVIIGAGPGGYSAAIRAAQLGARTVLVERDRLGGACLNWGCIPTKTLYKSSKLFQTMTKAEAFGLSCTGLEADLAAMVARKDKVVDQLKKGVAALLKKRKVDYITGRGRLLAPDRVAWQGADGEGELEAGAVILATGTEPTSLPGMVVDGERIHNVQTILDCRKQPESLLIIGAGVAGCEFAQVFSGLGTKIILNDILPGPIQGLDEETAKTFLRTLKKRKYQMIFGDAVARLTTDGNGVKAVTASGRELNAEMALVAVGGRPLTADLGLAGAGVETDGRGFIPVDEQCRTNVPGVYAIGDATGRLPLAHFAAHMGLTAVAHARGDAHAVFDESAVPKTVFTDPELAWVGLTEAEARERYSKVKTGSFLLRALGRTVADGHMDGLAKVVAMGGEETVVGVHLIGPHAAEWISEGALAVARGLTLEDLAETIHAHPTYPEALWEAVEDARGLALHKV